MFLGRLSLRMRIAVAMIPVVAMLALLSLTIWTRSLLKDDAFELAARMKSVVGRQEVAMEKMSEGLLGYFSDTSNPKFKKDKEAAVVAYAENMKEFITLTKDFPEIVEQNRAMTEFDKKTFGQLEAEMFTRIDEDDKPLKFFYEKYEPALKTRKENFKKISDLVETRVADLTDQAEKRKRQDVLMEIGLFLATFVFAIGLVVWILSANLSDADHYFQKTENVSQSLARSTEKLAQTLGTISDSNAKEAAALQEAIARIKEFTSATRKIADQVRKPRKASDIADQARVMNDIAVQARILSFNASVEAVRAGEYGKGFALVAEGIVNLAEMSARMAKELSEANGTDRMISEIAAASLEQMKSMEQISGAVVRLDRAIRKNGDALGSTVKSIDELEGRSKQLETIIAKLKSLFRGEKRRESFDETDRDRGDGPQIVSADTGKKAKKSWTSKDRAA